MKPELKQIKDQVIVITGASSGIGLATAEEAARQGAKLVLAARSGNALRDITRRLDPAGQNVIAVTCDVSDPKQVQHVADQAIARFGRIDTWVNNAGVSIFGRLDQVSLEDSRRVFDTNFWGVYHGSLTALPHLLANPNGGALINLGSEVSEAVIGLQGIYSASKHAVMGFTDALRVEIEEMDGKPVSITLIQPTATNTPYPQHARNYMDKEPTLPTPMGDPKDVAEAILDAAVHPTRNKKVGLMSRLNTTVAKLAPGLGDNLASVQAKRQQYDEPPRDPAGSLFRPSEQTAVVGQTRGTGGKKAG